MGNVVEAKMGRGSPLHHCETHDFTPWAWEHFLSVNTVYLYMIALCSYLHLHGVPTFCIKHFCLIETKPGQSTSV